MKPLTIFLLILALILQSSLTTIPLVFLVLLNLAVVYKEEVIFPVAFVFGIFLDLFSFHTLGITSAIFIIFLFLVLLYQRRFEIATNYFVGAASFLGSFVILFILGNTHLLIPEVIISGILGIIMFRLLQRVSV